VRHAPERAEKQRREEKEHTRTRDKEKDERGTAGAINPSITQTRSSSTTLSGILWVFSIFSAPPKRSRFFSISFLFLLSSFLDHLLSHRPRSRRYLYVALTLLTRSLYDPITTTSIAQGPSGFGDQVGEVSFLLRYPPTNIRSGSLSSSLFAIDRHGVDSISGR